MSVPISEQNGATVESLLRELGGLLEAESRQNGSSMDRTLGKLFEEMVELISRSHPTNGRSAEPDARAVQQIASPNSTAFGLDDSGSSGAGDPIVNIGSVDTGSVGSSSAGDVITTRASPSGGVTSAGAVGLAQIKSLSGAPPDAARPANSINVGSYGAKGDGKTDNTSALQAAFTAAQKSGQTVYIPPGVYAHSGTLDIKGISVFGAGSGTVLKATNPSQAAVELTGSGSVLSNLETTDPNAATRIPDANASSVWLNHASDATVSSVTEIGSGANSVTIDSSKNSTVKNDLGVGSNADGLAINDGSTDNIIENSVDIGAADDGISDDSYTSDANGSSGNEILGNLVADNRYGNDVTLAGARYDLVEGNVVVGGPKGGIDVFQDNASGTRVPTGNLVQDNVAVGLTAPSVSAFMDPGGINNQYYSSNNSQAKQYLDAVARYASFVATYNQDYVPGTGPGSNNIGGAHA